MSMSYSGTGVTQGPLSLSQGTTLTLNDPADYSVASAALQLQNNSGFTLTVQSAGATYNIMPFFAQTIPTIGGGQSITVTPSNPIQSAGNQTGGLTAVWLLPGQAAPIQDGALTPIIINSREQSPSSTSVSGTQYTYVYPLQATDQSQEYLFFPNGLSGYTISYTITGLTSGHVYASGSGFVVASRGSTALGPFQAFGSIDTAVSLVVISPSVAPVVEIVLFTGALNNSVSNTASTPLYIEGISGGTPVPVTISSGGGSSNVTVINTTTNPVPVYNTSSQPVYIEGISGGTAVPVTWTGGAGVYVVMGGDNSGDSNATTVVGLQGQAISGPGTATNQVLLYNGLSTWVPTSSTGTGNNVLATSPTLVTPALGTPSSGVLTNCTSIPVNQATGTLPLANLQAGGVSQYLQTGASGPTWVYAPGVTQIKQYAVANTALAATTATAITSFAIATAGTYVITATCLVAYTAATAIVDMWIGTNSASTTGSLAGSTTTVTSTGTYAVITVTAIAALTATQTLYMNAYASAACSIHYQSTEQSLANATGFTAFRIL